MSKSANGEILGVDPEALEAAIGFSGEAAPEAAGGQTQTFTSAPNEYEPPPPADQIPDMPTMSAIEQFYGSPTRITQPDAGYYDEFPLPGQAPVTQTAPQEAPYVPPDMPYVPLDDYSTASASAPATAGSYIGPSGFSAFDDSRDFLRDMFLPDMSKYIIEEDLPTFQQFDPTQLQDQINQLAIAEPMDTSQFLTASDLPTYDTSQFLTMSDLPTYDTSQFLTSQDLPTYQQFDPTQLQDQINQLAISQPMDTSQFLTAADLPTYDTSQFLTSADIPTYDTSQFLTSADLPTYQQFDPTGLQDQITALQSAPQMDTSQFLTTADLPTYQQFDSSALEKELADLRAQVGLLGQAPSQSFAQTQPYAPILDFAVR